METILVLNLTQETFFRYTKKNSEDKGYNKILLEFLTPPKETLLKDTEGLSHWERGDKIVFVPKKLIEYVEKKYGEINKDL
jgi:hypothetical protein